MAGILLNILKAYTTIAWINLHETLETMLSTSKFCEQWKYKLSHFRIKLNVQSYWNDSPIMHEKKVHRKRKCSDLHCDEDRSWHYLQQPKIIAKPLVFFVSVFFHHLLVRFLSFFHDHCKSVIACEEMGWLVGRAKDVNPKWGRWVVHMKEKVQ